MAVSDRILDLLRKTTARQDRESEAVHRDSRSTNSWIENRVRRKIAAGDRFKPPAAKAN